MNEGIEEDQTKERKGKGTNEQDIEQKKEQTDKRLNEQGERNRRLDEQTDRRSNEQRS